MIILKVAANFGGELHEAGASVCLPPLIENRMIENELAVKVGDSKVEQSETYSEDETSQSEISDFTCSICGKVCKNKVGYTKHIESCKKKSESNV